MSIEVLVANCGPRQALSDTLLDFPVETDWGNTTLWFPGTISKTDMLAVIRVRGNIMGSSTPIRRVVGHRNLSLSFFTHSSS